MSHRKSDPTLDARAEELIEQMGWSDTDLKMLAVDFIVGFGVQGPWTRFLERTAAELRSDTAARPTQEPDQGD